MSKDTAGERESKIQKKALTYTVDSEKRLSKTIDGQSIFVQKLKKTVFKMVEYEDAVYFIDTFGDCFVIDETPKFLFGMLSQPLCFDVVNDRIYSVDKYSRVWIHTLLGELINIAFIGEKILKCSFRENMCIVMTNKEPNVVNYYERKESSINGYYFLLFNCNFEPYCEQAVEECVNDCVKLVIGTNWLA